MTPQEQQMITSLIQRVQSAPLSEKDYDAEQLLQQGLGKNPDALYILAQTVLVQGYALEQAQKQLTDARASLDQMKQQAQQPKHSTSFLGSIFGSGESERPAPPPPPQYAPVPQSQIQPTAHAPVAAYGQTYAQPAPAGGGFLRGAMQTAAGVAAGALAFEGVESLMHGFGGGSASSGFGGFGGGAPREEIINNYYGEDSGRGHEQGGGHGFLGDDVEDRRQDRSSEHTSTSSFADTDDTGTDANDDTSFTDDGGSDDSSSDDSSFS